jgi:hypothetical protein
MGFGDKYASRLFASSSLWLFEDAYGPEDLTDVRALVDLGVKEHHAHAIAATAKVAAAQGKCWRRSERAAMR